MFGQGAGFLSLASLPLEAQPAAAAAAAAAISAPANPLFMNENPYNDRNVRTPPAFRRDGALIEVLVLVAVGALVRNGGVNHRRGSRVSGGERPLHA